MTGWWRRVRFRGSRRVARSGTLIGVALVTVVAAIDLATSESVILMSLTITGPLVTSFVARTRSTAMVAGYAFVTALVLGVPNDIFLNADHLVRLCVVASAGAVAVSGARQRVEREAAMARIAHVAEVAQEAILRPPPPLLGPMALAARYKSASHDALIGGDLYETAYTPHGVRVLVGDVQGKGLDAVQLAATAMACFRNVVFASSSLHDIAVAIDERVAKHLDDEQFVSIVVAEFPDGGGVRVVNCGHHPPLRLTASGISYLEPREADVPLGLAPEAVVEEFDLADGDRLLLYTDGLVEARDAGGAYFAVEDAVDGLRDPDLEVALERLLERLLHHVGGRLEDDMAVVLAERRPSG